MTRLVLLFVFVAVFMPGFTVNSEECGRSNLGEDSVRPAAVGPRPATPGDFPWHSAIYSKTIRGWHLRCAGTLVSRRALITAAHCVTVGCSGCEPLPMSTKYLRVVVGQLSRDANHREDNAVVRQVSEIRVPEEYRGKASNYAHDLALVVLRSKVQVSQFVMPACVDFTRTHQNTVATERTLGAYVVGWINFDELYPDDEASEDESGDLLQYTSSTVMDPEACYSTRLVIEPLPVSRDKLCIGDSAARWMFQEGNGGSALTHVFNDQHFVTGIACTRLSAGRESYGTYTNVSLHLDWLKDQLTAIDVLDRRLRG